MAMAFQTVSGILRGAMCGVFLCFGAATPVFSASATLPVTQKAPASPALDTDALIASLPQAGHDIALRFVETTGAVKNLSLLLLDDVKHDADVQAAIKQYGMAHVQNTVVKAIRAAQRQYASDWGSLLADIYRDHMSDDELGDIITNRDASQYFVKLLEQQEAIAAELSDRGRAIFGRARTDVMLQVQTALPT